VSTYWTGKAVLITGASSGLGWALAEALAPHDVHLGLLSRREAEMRRLAEALRHTGSRVWIRPCDVRDRAAVTRAVDGFAAEAGRIDVAWVNSGIGGETSRERWDWDLVEGMIDTNLKGAIYTTQACVRVMARQGGGTLVALSSAAAMRGLPGRGIYGATKIALGYYFEALAVEYPELRFTTIYPGFVDTPINRGNPNRIFLLTPERAASIMLRAVERGRRELVYPWQMRWLFRLTRALPFSVFRRIAGRTQMGRPAGPSP
jgi:NAD(P)-dependent dehydrogenase (short-subunit alcohol dehydrogenase family)